MWFTHLFGPCVTRFPLSVCTGLLNTGKGKKKKPWVPAMGLAMVTAAMEVVAAVTAAAETVVAVPAATCRSRHWV